MLYKASAPGSLMLLGEYGVLYGKQAVACAINQRIHAELKPRQDNRILIHCAYGTMETQLHRISIEPPFQFVLHAIQHAEARLRHGFELTIESDFSDQMGLGSSAAVTVSVLSLLYRLQKAHIGANELIRQARIVVRRAQHGLGSGADVAASVHGGVVAYQTEPLYSEKFNIALPLTVVYSGHKKKTTDTINHVKQSFLHHPYLAQSIYNAIGQCASAGIQCLRKLDLTELGRIAHMQHGLMQALGVSTPFLNDLVEQLQTQPNVFGAKLSGSGLGDCVIAIGNADESLQPPEPAVKLSVSTTTTGVICEEN